MENIKERIVEELLPLITKPGRFLGNELGSICHPIENRVSIALAYPDLYDLGMSNLGLQILYYLINSHPHARAERVFAVAEDVAVAMRNRSIPLFSLESKTPLKEFDLVGFNSATELNYTNILDMLALAGIPLISGDRTENDPLVVIGGGCSFNPEPLADFADLFFIGEAEEAIVEIIESLLETKNAPRDEKLRRLISIQGVYIPSLYQANYVEPGRFQKLIPFIQGAPEKIIARKTAVLKSEYYPRRPLVPVVETVHDRLSVEIMRGCGHACRFCQASAIYRPARARKVEDIIAQVESNLRYTGFDDVTLLSLSSGDYKEIENLVSRLMEKLQKKMVTVSLPSLRISGLSLELAQMIMTNQKTGLTFAPEAGTERLRQVINKPLPEETLLTVLSEAFRQGWQTIKLYFMIGLPTETEDDLKGIADLMRRLCNISDKFRGRRTFNVTVSTFSPKAHTPWQWERQISIEEIKSKREFLRRCIRERNVFLKFHEPEITWLEGILARGDRRLGRVIQKAYQLGAVRDGWSEHFRHDLWQRAFAEEQINPDTYLVELSTGEFLPWDHIEIGLSKQALMRELAHSRGLGETEISLDKTDDSHPPEMTTKKFERISEVTYGRTPKTIKAVANLQIPHSRLRLKWGRGGLGRFLSHLDNMRAIERALRRAGLPVSFSQGHRPRPKLSFGPPLALGMTSESEYLDIQLDTTAQAFMLDNLSRDFPPDFTLIETRSIPGKAASLSSLLNLAVYQVDLPINRDIVAEKLATILGAAEFRFQRETKSGLEEIEMRRAIIDLQCTALDNALTRVVMQTGMADLGFIKPNELLQHGMELNRDEIQRFKIHRKALYRLENGILIDPFDLK